LTHPVARKAFKAGVVYLLLGTLAVSTVLPFLWMLFTSFKPLNEVDGGGFLPRVWQWENYSAVFEQVRFGRYYLNSVFVALWVTVLTCLTSALAAYSFARLNWKGKDALFQLYLGTLMIPGVVTQIPGFALIVGLGLLDTYSALIIPSSFSAFGVFLLRQVMKGVPPALDEAATIDGATSWQILWDIVLPLSRAGLITLSIFTFMGSYGALMGPLIMTKSDAMRTLPVGLTYFNSAYAQQTNLMMAASVMSVVPPLLLFLIGQKHLIKGIQLGGVKG
jgi:multiple sugar transport system permease protein